MTLSGHFILLNFIDIMVINIFYLRIFVFFSIFSKNNIICTLWFFPNKDSLDRARQKANNYSSSDEQYKSNKEEFTYFKQKTVTKSYYF